MRADAFGDEHHADQEQEAEGQHFDRGMPLDEARDRPAKTIITPTATIMAAIMTQICSAMPTAVITESSEKMMSRMAIWTMTAAEDEPAPRPVRRRGRLRSCREFRGRCCWIRNSPPTRRIRSRTEIWLTSLVVLRASPRTTPNWLSSNSDVVDFSTQVDAEQQQDPRAHRRQQADPAGQRLLVGRQAAADDRDEDDVVDAQDDFHRRQGDEGNGRLRRFPCHLVADASGSRCERDSQLCYVV